MNMRTRAKVLFDAPAPGNPGNISICSEPQAVPLRRNCSGYVTDYTIAVCGKSRPPRDCHA
jgi:hypothetical protein